MVKIYNVVATPSIPLKTPWQTLANGCNVLASIGDAVTTRWQCGNVVSKIVHVICVFFKDFFNKL